MFGGEIGIPKMHISKKHLDTLCFGIVADKELTENRILFLSDMKNYLAQKEVNCGKICKTNHKDSDDSGLFRLLISLKLENVMNFQKNIKIRYCKYKSEKLKKTIGEFIRLKKAKYYDLIGRGCGAERAMNLLQISPRSLFKILTYEDISP